VEKAEIPRLVPRQPMTDDVYSESVLAENKHVGHEDFGHSIGSGAGIEPAAVLCIYAFDDVEQD
jgi:hypothetical protein